jgi:expansin (peptidoglycan-binding protein)
MFACGDGASDDAADTADSAADSGGQMTAATDEGGDPTAGAVCEATMHTGEATYYAATGAGACSFDASPNDLDVAAMNMPDYAGSAVCGACATVEGPSGTITVRIVDLCPGCASGDLDLSESAFAKIADPVSCPVSGDIRYRFKEGSSQYWAGVQVRDHRNAIATLEFKDEGGAWHPVARESYNYFVQDGGMGAGPLHLRVTDVEGNVLEDADVPLLDAQETPGGGQFPGCSP